MNLPHGTLFIILWLFTVPAVYSFPNNVLFFNTRAALKNLCSEDSSCPDNQVCRKGNNGYKICLAAPKDLCSNDSSCPVHQVCRKGDDEYKRCFVKKFEDYIKCRNTSKIVTALTNNTFNEEENKNRSDLSFRSTSENRLHPFTKKLNETFLNYKAFNTTTPKKHRKAGKLPYKEPKWERVMEYYTTAKSTTVDIKRINRSLNEIKRKPITKPTVKNSKNIPKKSQKTTKKKKSKKVGEKTTPIIKKVRATTKPTGKILKKISAKKGAKIEVGKKTTPIIKKAKATIKLVVKNLKKTIKTSTREDAKIEVGKITTPILIKAKATTKPAVKNLKKTIKTSAKVVERRTNNKHAQKLMEVGSKKIRKDVNIMPLETAKELVKDLRNGAASEKKVKKERKYSSDKIKNTIFKKTQKSTARTTNQIFMKTITEGLHRTTKYDTERKNTTEKAPKKTRKSNMKNTKKILIKTKRKTIPGILMKDKTDIDFVKKTTTTAHKKKAAKKTALKYAKKTTNKIIAAKKPQKYTTRTTRQISPKKTTEEHNLHKTTKYDTERKNSTEKAPNITRKSNMKIKKKILIKTERKTTPGILMKDKTDIDVVKKTTTETANKATKTTAMEYVQKTTNKITTGNAVFKRPKISTASTTTKFFLKKVTKEQKLHGITKYNTERKDSTEKAPKITRKSNIKKKKKILTKNNIKTTLRILMEGKTNVDVVKKPKIETAHKKKATKKNAKKYIKQTTNKSTSTTHLFKKPKKSTARTTTENFLEKITEEHKLNGTTEYDTKRKNDTEKANKITKKPNMKKTKKILTKTKIKSTPRIQVKDKTNIDVVKKSKTETAHKKKSTKKAAVKYAKETTNKSTANNSLFKKPKKSTAENFLKKITEKHKSHGTIKYDTKRKTTTDKTPKITKKFNMKGTKKILTEAEIKTTSGILMKNIFNKTGVVKTTAETAYKIKATKKNAMKYVEKITNKSTSLKEYTKNLIKHLTSNREPEPKDNQSNLNIMKTSTFHGLFRLKTFTNEFSTTKDNDDQNELRIKNEHTNNLIKHLISNRESELKNNQLTLNIMKTSTFHGLFKFKTFKNKFYTTKNSDDQHELSTQSNFKSKVSGNSIQETKVTSTESELKTFTNEFSFTKNSDGQHKLSTESNFQSKITGNSIQETRAISTESEMKTFRNEFSFTKNSDGQHKLRTENKHTNNLMKYLTSNRESELKNNQSTSNIMKTSTFHELFKFKPFKNKFSTTKNNDSQNELSTQSNFQSKVTGNSIQETKVAFTESESVINNSTQIETKFQLKPKTTFANTKASPDDDAFVLPFVDIFYPTAKKVPYSIRK